MAVEKKEDIVETNPISTHLANLEAEAQAKQKRAEEDRAKAESLYNDFAEARKNGGNAIATIVESSKPKREVAKEKNERILTYGRAFSDMLSALTAGAMASGKKGGRYIPKGAFGAPFDNLNKLSDLQEEYAKRQKEWEGVKLKYDMQHEQDKIDAAQALATTAEAKAKKSAEEAEKARKAYNDYAADLARDAAKEEAAERRNSANIASRERVAQINANNGKAYKDWDDESSILLSAYDAIYPWEATEYEDVRETYDNEGALTGTSKGINKTTYAQEKPMRQAAARKDEYAHMVLRGMKELGLSFDESLNRVLAYIERSKNK